METHKNNKLSWLFILYFFCIPVLTTQASALTTLSKLVKPGGVKIPVIVNVLG